jgi:arylsulfatase A-like enzyme
MKHLLFLFALLLNVAVFTNSLAAVENTNFVVVLIDDMGYSDLSPFGGKDAQTPNIDSLAKEGQRFTSFYTAAPICSPSRCGIITGQYPQRWNITSYLDNRKRNEERGVAQWLDVKAPAFPRLLQKAGYATLNNGKIFHFPADHNDGWSEPAWRPEGENYVLQENLDIIKQDHADKVKAAAGQNTIVIFWGDHGWHLGEHTQWSKHSVFENTMNAPLILRLPGQKEGKRFTLPVEFIDIYPTLNELAGLPEPKKDQLQGKSLIPLLDGKVKPEKLYAAGRYKEGDTIFDGRFRYSEYRDNEGGGKIVSRMLYDHSVDPRENVNIINDPKNKDIIEELAKELNRTIALP